MDFKTIAGIATALLFVSAVLVPVVLGTEPHSARWNWLMLTMVLIAGLATTVDLLAAFQYDREHGSARRWLARPGEHIHRVMSQQRGSVPLAEAQNKPMATELLFTLATAVVIAIAWLPIVIVLSPG